MANSIVRRLALLVVLFTTCSPSQGQQYNRGDYGGPRGDHGGPRRPAYADLGPRQEGGKMMGLMKTGVTYALASWAFGQVWFRFQARRIKSAHQKKSEKLIAQYQKQKESLHSQFGEAYQTVEFNSEYIDSLINQLESILQHPDTDPNKRKFAEFKLPDANNDDKISRAEFNAYLKTYFAAHPELADVEYPTFDDFDLNDDGTVGFAEWKKFISDLEAKNEKEALPYR